jgi:hypothetical protein
MTGGGCRGAGVSESMKISPSRSRTIRVNTARVPLTAMETMAMTAANGKAATAPATSLRRRRRRTTWNRQWHDQITNNATLMIDQMIQN